MSRTKAKARKPNHKGKGKDVSELCKIRVEKYGTLRDAAKEIGLSTATLLRLEKGNPNVNPKPNATTLRKFSVFYGVPLRKLMKQYWG